LAYIPEEPRPLLEEAALQAFGDFGTQQLSFVCRVVGTRVPPTASLFTKLWTIVKHVCPRLSDEEVMAVLSLRLKVDQSMLDLVMLSEEASDLIDDQDKKQLQTIVDRIRRTRVSSGNSVMSSRRSVAINARSGSELVSPWHTPS
jgi:hypothetical protein